MIRILSISGSLRQASSYSALLRAAAALAPRDAEVCLYTGISRLPLFNSDLATSESSSVIDFRTQLRQADGVLIASPEYAHGVPGALKNALDWVVESGEFIEKPLALLNASLRAKHATAALQETLSKMMAHLVKEASFVIPFPTNKISTQEIPDHLELSPILLEVISTFVNAIKSKRLLTVAKKGLSQDIHKDEAKAL